MKPEDLRGVFAVPPLSRRNDEKRSLDFEQNDLLTRHIVQGGVTRLLYGGNAFLYHITLDEYEALLDWLSSFGDGLWAIPSIGPSFGRAMDQAELLKKYHFPCAMMLPCADPRDADGLERGLREIAHAAAMPLVVYLKDETNFGAEREVGLDAVARLVEDGVCSWIKYAVIRPNPSDDPYLASLLLRVPRERVISGIGERPAIVHLREWGLPGFTTGSGCLAPTLTSGIFKACSRGDYQAAARLRDAFIPHEDLRDAWGPSRVLHFATELGGVARTGPVPPFLSPLSTDQVKTLAPVASALVKVDSQADASYFELPPLMHKS